MSEFKFSCPNCQQNIKATSEYSGLQINCPSCQTPLVVPADPNTPAPAAAPGSLVPEVPKGAGRLSMAKSTGAPEPASSASAAAMMYGRQVVSKKKSKTGLIVGISVGVCAVVAAIIFWPALMKKVKHDNQADAAAIAATNEPPPPPPPLTTEEILQNVADAYKGMTDYSAQAQTVANLDMSALVPGKTAPVVFNTTSSLQLGRTNNYRLEWEQKASGTTIKGAAWSSGKGNFVGYGPIAPTKVKTRELALQPAAAALILSAGIAELFYSETNSLAAEAKSFTKTNGPSLNNGQDCYVLTGEQNHMNFMVWVNKRNFLINQIELTLGEGKMDPAELKKLPAAERNQMIALSKIKGTVTETYDNIHTNQNLPAASFESVYQPPANPAAGQSQRAGTMAGQLANPRRGRSQPQ